MLRYGEDLSDVLDLYGAFCRLAPGVRDFERTNLWLTEAGRNNL